MTSGDQSFMRNRSTESMPQIVILGIPDSRRVLDFIAVAEGLGLDRPRVISYKDFITGNINIDEAIKPDCVVRIESPGGCWETERLILREGITPLEIEGIKPTSWSELQSKQNSRGEIHSPRQWIAGFCA